MAINRPLHQTSFISDSNLVSYWHFENDVTDFKNANNGTNYGVSFAYDKPNFSYNGVFVSTESDIIALPNNASLKPTSFTFSWWQKGMNGGNIFTNFRNIGQFIGWAVMVNNWGEKLCIRSFTANGLAGGLKDYICSSTIPYDTGWHHYAVTYASSVMKYYIDGQYFGSSTNEIAYTTTMTPTIGARNDVGTPTDFLNASLDDLALFSRVLSNDEIASIYSMATPERRLGEYIGSGSGTTKLYVPFNGNCIDFSGNDSTGVPYNVTYLNEKFNKGIKFAGTTTSYVLFPSTSMNFGTNDYALSFWVKLPVTRASNFSCAIGNGATSWDSHFYNIQIDRLANPGVVTIYYPGNLNTIFGTIDINDNAWHHIVHTKLVDTTYLYIDGKLDVSSTNFGNVDLSYNGYLMAGSNKFDGENAPFGGALDELIVENVGWSAEKVKKYYTNANGRYASL